MAQQEFTTITIVKGRRRQLLNQLIGIAESTVLPNEHIVIMMDDESVELPQQAFPIKILRVKSHELLPLALARNEGWHNAATDNLVFLDVDCIPSPELFSALLKELDTSTMTTAYPRYLRNIPVGPWAYKELFISSLEHPGRKNIAPGKSVEPELFWSLVFAAKKQMLQQIGGFDEGYSGYGAEDTDFAVSTHAHGVDIVFVNDTVLHQYHDKYDPPLQHFEDIVTNATYFYKKWGTWPMQHWLQGFEKLGLVKLHKDRIETLASPTSQMLKDAHSDLPY